MNAKRKTRKAAYLHFWSGTFSVLEYPSQKLVAKSKMRDPRHVIYRARKKGFDVKVYVGFGTKVYKAFA